MFRKFNKLCNSKNYILITTISQKYLSSSILVVQSVQRELCQTLDLFIAVFIFKINFNVNKLVQKFFNVMLAY